MESLKPKTSCKTLCFFLNDAMFWRFFGKQNIDVDVFDNVPQNAKHRANDASNDVNRPPLTVRAHCTCRSNKIKELHARTGQELNTR